ncbi:hypothetical protein HDE_11871 [Halotydeus destructor]|nr:hypothetical protein HDE_11871 [Halotydeus destructor]
MKQVLILAVAILAVEADTNLLEFFCTKLNWDTMYPMWKKCADEGYPELVGKNKDCYVKVYQTEYPKNHDDFTKTACKIMDSEKKLKEWNDCYKADTDVAKGAKVGQCFDKQLLA